MTAATDTPTRPSRAGAVPRYSIVIPVYRNADSVPQLVQRLDALDEQLGGGLEVVFVVDGCPARSHEILAEQLPTASFASALVMHSRNFGSFAAIRTGLAHASGSYIGVMAADLQEPPELMIDFFAALERDEADVVVGVRRTRADAALSTISARLFWGVYRRLVQREMPPGGIDVFGCTRPFRDRLLTLEESNSSLVALTLWLGFRRATIEYDRQAREHGPSGWTLRKKLKYLSDSIFSFTDLPIRLLLGAGLLGVLGSVALATVVAIARLSGAIAVPGYAATIMVIAFFAALNLAGIGILGAYVWRTFENTKGRPGAVVMGEQRFAARRRQ